MTDRYTETALLYVESFLEYSAGLIAEQCESPIEIGFAKGLLALRLTDRRIVFDALPSGPLLTEWEARVFAQHCVGNYRLDFAIHLTAKKGGREISEWIGIECDGHDYHERTREQAKRDKSRDRELTASGIRMFRFTGSEIFENNIACAKQIQDYLINRVAELDDE